MNNEIILSDSTDIIEYIEVVNSAQGTVDNTGDMIIIGEYNPNIPDINPSNTTAITGVTSLGNGYSLSAGIANHKVKLKSLLAGSNLSISATTNNLILNASILNSFIQLVDSVGNFEVNNIIPMPINWNVQEYSGRSINFTGGSRIYVTTTGHYNISYSINISNQTDSVKLIGSSIRKNGVDFITQLTTTSGDIFTINNNGTNQMPIYTMLLFADDYVELMVFRSGNSGSALSKPNESWIRIEKI